VPSETNDRFGVLLRLHAAAQQAACLAAVSPHGDRRLDGEWQPPELSVCRARCFGAKPVRVELHQGIEPRVEPLDPRNVLFGEFRGRDAATPQQGQLLDSWQQRECGGSQLCALSKKCSISSSVLPLVSGRNSVATRK